MRSRLGAISSDTHIHKQELEPTPEEVRLQSSLSQMKAHASAMRSEIQSFETSMQKIQDDLFVNTTQFLAHDITASRKISKQIQGDSTVDSKCVLLAKLHGSLVFSSPSRRRCGLWSQVLYRVHLSTLTHTSLNRSLLQALVRLRS